MVTVDTIKNNRAVKGLRPMDLASLIFTCNQQTSVLLTCKHNLINHLMQNLAQRGQHPPRMFKIFFKPHTCKSSTFSILIATEWQKHMDFFMKECKY